MTRILAFGKLGSGRTVSQEVAALRRGASVVVIDHNASIRREPEASS